MDDLHTVYKGRVVALPLKGKCAHCKKEVQQDQKGDKTAWQFLFDPWSSQLKRMGNTSILCMSCTLELMAFMNRL